MLIKKDCNLGLALRKCFACINRTPKFIFPVMVCTYRTLYKFKMCDK